MRFVVFGAGAVGSVIAARLHQGGADVVMIGRAAHVEAVERNGLAVRTAPGCDVVRVSAATSLVGIAPSPNDVVIVTAKTQDTPAIHDAVQRWNADAAIVCGTNGVEHERIALRRFSRVYAMVVQMPAGFGEPGVVAALSSPVNALLDVGRYPHGVDATAEAICAALRASGHIVSEPDADIMTKKYAKVLMNLGNVADAACGLGSRFAPVCKAAIAEARTVYDVAGIRHEVVDGASRERYANRLKSAITFAIPDGETFVGGSTWQSLAKGAPSLETDFFNGEIVLLGRLHGVPTPHNLFLQRLADELLYAGASAESMTPEQLDARWRLFLGESA